MPQASSADPAAATETAQGHIEAAGNDLAIFAGRIVNGHGMYADPSSLRGKIASARAHLDAAIAAIDAADWTSPTKDAP